MTILERRQQLIQQINVINDEDILSMLEEELSYYLHNGKDMTDELTPYELNELKILASDMSDDNTVSLDEYKKSYCKMAYKIVANIRFLNRLPKYNVTLKNY